MSEPLHPSLMSIPDLTNKIVRPNNGQYCAAGGFGDVFRCQYMSDDGVKEVAVKAFRFSFSVDGSDHKRDGEKAARMIRRELGIWRRLNHRNVVPFLGIAYGFGRQGSASLVSLWMPHGTLHMFLEAHGDQLAAEHRLQLLLDIANGLHYLHSLPMIHGDLSSNNVLLDHNFNACLTDFGCATLVGELPEGFTYLKMSTMRPGTLRWAAPEHFSLDEEETRHTIKSDIYSFGNMALLVLSGEYPWAEVRADASVVLRLSRGLKPARPHARPIDDLHWGLVERCWSSIPERPLAEDVVSSLQQLLGTAKVPGTTELAIIGSQNDLVSGVSIDDVSWGTLVPTPIDDTHQNIVTSSTFMGAGRIPTSSGPSPESAEGQEACKHKAKALYSYSASPDDPHEVSFIKDEILDVLDKESKWWDVKKTDGTTGIAPSNYLQIITDNHKVYKYKAKALYAYDLNPDDPDEISFLRGEILDIVDMRGKWWDVKKADGTIGIAPSNFLQII